MTWSKIQYTELATEAYIRMNDNEIAGCQYHNNQHIEEMYQYLEDTNEPYDSVLDWAIMFHDVVYDDKPEKELRSAAIFIELWRNSKSNNDLNIGQADDIYNLIINTADHKYAGYHNSSAIIRADLHALADKVKTTENFVKIMNESIALYGCTVEEFATNNIAFMSGLHERVAANSSVDKDHKELYSKILNGIDLTIRLAQTLKDTR
jgi:predicted metal-dependent HD superfamily phosphohydrolase